MRPCQQGLLLCRQILQILRSSCWQYWGTQWFHNIFHKVCTSNQDELHFDRNPADFVPNDHVRQRMDVWFTINTCPQPSDADSRELCELLCTFEGSCTWWNIQNICNIYNWCAQSKAAATGLIFQLFTIHSYLKWLLGIHSLIMIIIWAIIIFLYFHIFKTIYQVHVLPQQG